jgi:hypothetical protein
MVNSVKKAVNDVFLDDQSVVRCIYHGRQTAISLLETTTKILEIMRGLVEQDKPVRLLADIRDLSDYDQPSRIVEMQARTALPFWKMAFVTAGAQTSGEKVSRTLTSMSGRKGQIRYFKREDDAIGWLSFMNDRWTTIN